MPSTTPAIAPERRIRWGADTLRLIWAALYWNWAKTWFRWRGARGRAPCQHPSDSSRAGEAGCEACIHFANPRRFAQVCPLIRYDSPQGPRCSVAAADARPFWGRVLAGLAVVGFGGSTLLLILAWSGFHLVGYRLRPSDLAWPPHWNRIALARADYYAQRGFAAYARGDARACYLALLEAHQLRPGDFAVNRLLAQVAAPNAPEFADGLYGQLVRAPDGRLAANAAQEWGDSLLARCNFAALSQLSAYMLRRGSDSAPAWANALIFSVGRGADGAAVRDLSAAPVTLPADCRDALQWSLRAPDPVLAAELQRAARDSGSLYRRHYAFSRLIELGEGRSVLTLLAAASGLPARERESLRLAALGALGETDARQREIVRLLATEPGAPALIEVLSAHLIRYPDRVSGDRLQAAVARHPLPLVAENYRIYAALACLAGVERDAANLRRLTAILGTISGRPFGRQVAVPDIFLDPAPDRSLSPALVALQPLPLEVMYAMLADYPRWPTAPPQPPEPQRAG